MTMSAGRNGIYRPAAGSGAVQSDAATPATTPAGSGAAPGASGPAATSSPQKASDLGADLFELGKELVTLAHTVWRGVGESLGIAQPAERGAPSPGPIAMSAEQREMVFGVLDESGVTRIPEYGDCGLSHFRALPKSKDEALPLLQKLRDTYASVAPVGSRFHYPGVTVDIAGLPLAEREALILQLDGGDALQLLRHGNPAFAAPSPQLERAKALASQLGHGGALQLRLDEHGLPRAYVYGATSTADAAHALRLIRDDLGPLNVHGYALGTAEMQVDLSLLTPSERGELFNSTLGAGDVARLRQDAPWLFLSTVHLSANGARTHVFTREQAEEVLTGLQARHAAPYVDGLLLIYPDAVVDMYHIPGPERVRALEAVFAGAQLPAFKRAHPWLFVDTFGLDAKRIASNPQLVDARLRPFLSGWEVVDPSTGERIAGAVVRPTKYFQAVKRPGSVNPTEPHEVQLYLEVGKPGVDADGLLVLRIAGDAVLTGAAGIQADVFAYDGEPLALYHDGKLVTQFAPGDPARVGFQYVGNLSADLDQRPVTRPSVHQATPEPGELRAELARLRERYGAPDVDPANATLVFSDGSALSLAALTPAERYDAVLATLGARVAQDLRARHPQVFGAGEATFTIAGRGFSADDLSRVDPRLAAYVGAWSVAETYNGGIVHIPGSWDSHIYPTSYHALIAASDPKDPAVRHNEAQLTLAAGWRNSDASCTIEGFDDELIINMGISGADTLSDEGKVWAQIIKPAGAKMRILLDGHDVATLEHDRVLVIDDLAAFLDRARALQSETKRRRHWTKV